jgi:hypothetical protein
LARVLKAVLYSLKLGKLLTFRQWRKNSSTHEVPLGKLIVGPAQLFIVLALVRGAQHEFDSVPCLFVITARAKLFTIDAPVSVIKAGQASPVGIQGHHFGNSGNPANQWTTGRCVFAQVFEKKPICDSPWLVVATGFEIHSPAVGVVKINGFEGLV